MNPPETLGVALCIRLSDEQPGSCVEEVQCGIALDNGLDKGACDVNCAERFASGIADEEIGHREVCG